MKFVLLAILTVPLVLALAGCTKPAGRQASLKSSGNPAQSRTATPGTATEADRETILQTVLCDILTSPRFQDEREFYGGAAKNRVALIKDSPVPWPASFPPKISGFQLFFDSQESLRASDQSPFLALRVDKFDLGAPIQGPEDSHLEITVFNIGGGGNNILIAGGCSIRYEVERLADKWKVEWVSLRGQ